MKKKSLSEALKQQVLFGPFMKTADPFFSEAAARAGFDFMIFDAEHGPNSPREMIPLILTAESHGCIPVVRVGSLSQIEIQRTLDMGVGGVQIPQIETREDAEKAVLFSKFHPQGMRGVCRYVRAADYSLKDKSEYFAQQNRDVAVIIHIEGERAVSNIDAIISVSGIDVIFIGPYDLSQSLGVPGEISHPRVTEAIEVIAQKCRVAGKCAGIFADSADTAKRYAEMGIGYVATSVDVGIFTSGCCALLKDIKGVAPD